MQANSTVGDPLPSRSHSLARTDSQIYTLLISRGLGTHAIEDGKIWLTRRQPVGFRLPYMLRGVRRGTRVFVYDAELSARSYPGGYVGTT